MNLRSVAPDRLSIPAKLFLVSAILIGLGTGIWSVVLQLYLVSLGFDSATLGILVMMNYVGTAYMKGGSYIPFLTLMDLRRLRWLFLY